ncbi:MAG: hypothetical protein MZV70_22685 [Desulfobacterales bacterium]|nr:hypothetical protein [Desulfobacterales bacterium]
MPVKHGSPCLSGGGRVVRPVARQPPSHLQGQKRPLPVEDVPRRCSKNGGINRTRFRNPFRGAGGGIGGGFEDRGM